MTNCIPRGRCLNQGSIMSTLPYATFAQAGLACNTLIGTRQGHAEIKMVMAHEISWHWNAFCITGHLCEEWWITLAKHAIWSFDVFSLFAQGTPEQTVELLVISDASKRMLHHRYSTRRKHRTGLLTIVVADFVNSSPPSAIYMCQWIGSALGISINDISKFPFRKMHLIMSSAKWG